MSFYKELFAECEMKFGEVVRAVREKDSKAMWLLFEYIEFRITKQREYENASTKRDSKKNSGVESDKSSSDEDQFSFGFIGRSGH